METKKLQALLETAKNGSVNKVAESLGYTQSGLTYALNSLENEVGVKLLHRDHSGVSLTPEGQELLPLMECIVTTVESFELRISRIKARSSGAIHIGTYNSALIRLLPNAVDRFLSCYPDTQFEITTGVDSLSRLMDDETLDLAICEEHIASGNYQWEKLLEDEMCAVLRTDDPLSKKKNLCFSELKNSHVIYPAININGVVARRLREEGIQFGRQTNLVTVDGSITLSVISRRGGVSFVSRMYEPECPANVRFVSMEPKLIRSLGVARPIHSPRSKTLDRFVGQLKKSI